MDGCILVASILSAVASGPAAPRQPDIVLILTDDMGYSDIGPFGGEISTPHLDGLAAGGIRLTHFYNAARCCPTRASLLTGQHPHRAGIGHMMSDRGRDGYRGDLRPDCVTIAEALRGAGYSTYMTGKWHVTKSTGQDGPKDNWPTRRGFDRFYGTITGAGSYYDPPTLVRDEGVLSALDDREYAPPRYYYTDAIGDHAARFVEEHRRDRPERPFFLYAAFTAAHWPLQAPEEDVARYRGRYDGGYDPVRKARLERLRALGIVPPGWEAAPTRGNWDAVADKAWEARCMEVYAAMVDRMDRAVGRIVDALRRGGRLDDTLILYLQDNGGCAEEVGRRGSGAYRSRPGAPPFPPIPRNALPTAVIPPRTRAGFPVVQGPGVLPGPEDTYIAYGEGWANVSNTPFREYKHWVHEGGIATPLIAHWPARIRRKGDLEREPGQLIDILPTCLDAAGAAYPAERGGLPVRPTEGKSLLPAFEGRPIEREGLFWEHEGNRAVRQGEWKLVAKGPAGAWELYDLEADRTELHDLAAAEPDRVRRMAAGWEAWARRSDVIPWIWGPPYGPDPEDVGSKERSFRLEAGARLEREEAPRIAGKAFGVRAALASTAANGVIVAQGGSSQGFALYVKGRRPALALRVNGSITSIAGPEPLPEGPVEVSARVGAAGELSLAVGGATVAEGRAPAPIPRMPLDGLQVGRDDGGAVGPYRTPFAFGGKIDEVVIRIGE